MGGSIQSAPSNPLVTESGWPHPIPWATLVPDPHNGIMNRAGFAIHGRGQHGSDGCIVPFNPVDFQRLMDALEADGGGVLQVMSAMGSDFA